MPESTPRGYPVPVLGDPVDDGSGHLNAFWDLASAIDADVSGRVLDVVTADTTVVNTAAETALYSKALPTDLEAGETLRLLVMGDYLNDTGSSQTVQMRLKLGATTMLATATPSFGASASRHAWIVRGELFVRTPTVEHCNAVWQTAVGTNTWDSPPSFGTLAGYGVAAEDLTSAKTLALTVQLGAANASLDYKVHAALLERIR